METIVLDALEEDRYCWYISTLVWHLQALSLPIQKFAYVSEM